MSNRAALRPSPCPLALAAIGALDLGLAAAVGDRVGFTGWARPLAALAFLGGLSAFYRMARPRPELADLADHAAGWVALATVGGAGVYLAAGLGLPLWDQRLEWLDAGLGFHRLDWLRWIQAHPGLDLALRFSYASLLPQILLLLIGFAFLGRTEANGALLFRAATGLLATVALSALMPALGPLAHTAPGLAVHYDTAYLGDLARLRAGGPATFDLAKLQGIVSFPSYHAFSAVLLTHAGSRLRRLRWPLLALNGLMLASTLSVGGHYLADALAGAGLAAAAISLPVPAAWRAPGLPAAPRACAPSPAP